jgi:hypothetical protein
MSSRPIGARPADEVKEVIADKNGNWQPVLQRARGSAPMSIRKLNDS